MTELISLDIIPAFFVEWTETGAILICYLGQSKLDKPVLQKREFPRILVEPIKNPTKILIGRKHEIIREEGESLIARITITFICGKRYRKPFTWLKEYIKKK
ncbi:MAG: hypothetical protein WC606_01945 [Candidatus Absconditabacterales bacterium]|jgi:hypothetical protein